MPYPDNVPFIPGLDLCERFFFDLVKPLLDKDYPSLEYVACRLGEGSDVLGFDTNQSRDHDWGPKFDLLLEDEQHIDELNTFFSKHLRGKLICGYSTQFQRFTEQDGATTLINTPDDDESTCHGIRIMTMKQFFVSYLDWQIGTGEPTLEDWLTFPSQHLLTIVRGRVFHDCSRLNIARIRTQLAYYPKDVWLYLIGCCWQRIGQEEHLMCRAGQAEDELGSAIIASRLIRDVMRLTFLLEKQYCPYAKWFGTAFRRCTTHGSSLEPILRQVQLAQTWQEREQYINQAYERLALLTKEKLSDIIDSTKYSISSEISQFHGRPFYVINGGAIADITFAQIENAQIRQLPRIGSTDLFIDNTDAMLSELRLKMKRIFQ
ncbi:unnamed protein product [Adineta ricciae]|uniref:DUF4037 domain-containing protein n=1 Tax=Adineta ricciae TaxID=249248 RepID=A0A814XXM2_ADIRI|nr:unnamed protein product [Adineta ricciae]